MSADSRLVSVLAVMAHRDDGELRAGGTLASTPATRLSPWPWTSPARMAEAAAGTAILGVRLRPLAVPCTAAAIVDLITATRPDVLITHPLADVHPGHRDIAGIVFAALPEAVIATGHPQRVYTTGTYNSLTLNGPVNAHAIIDITPPTSRSAGRSPFTAEPSLSRSISDQWQTISPVCGVPASGYPAPKPSCPSSSSAACPACCASDRAWPATQAPNRQS